MFWHNSLCTNSLIIRDFSQHVLTVYKTYKCEEKVGHAHC